MEDIKLEIPKVPDDPNPISLNLKNGDQLFIVGANGSGKSVLMQRFTLGNNNVEWIVAHRQTWFAYAKTNLSLERREQFEKDRISLIARNEARWKDSYGENNLSALLFDLDHKYNIINESIAQNVRDKDMVSAEKIAIESPSPFDQINMLLGIGSLTVSLERAKDRSILARHPNGDPFSIAEMSDGERSAVIIASHVITAEPGTLFLIDEPERHLHRSIIEPFLSALFEFRKEDCTFVVATHEIALPIANPEAQILVVRSCEWENSRCVSWDAEILEPNSQLPDDLKLPEELKHDILGSRKKILFVEGSSNSLDFRLYKILFPDISVIPKGSCEEVQKAVIGLRDSQDNHHVEAFGLIDRDNMPPENVKKLREKGVFALEVYAVESLYYCSDAIAAIADQQAESLNEDKNKLIESANKQAIDALKINAERMTARRCERQVKEKLSKSLNWEMIIDNPTQSIKISINNPFTDELKHFNKLVEEENLNELIDRYPARESGAFEIIAKSLRCLKKKDYERRVITQIQGDNELAEKLKKRIGPLSSRLDQIEDPETI